MSPIVSFLSPIIVHSCSLCGLVPNGLCVVLNEQINKLIDARGFNRVLTFVSLNGALTQREIVGKYGDARFEHLRYLSFSSLLARCQNAVLHEKHGDVVAPLPQRCCSIGQK